MNSKKLLHFFSISLILCLMLLSGCKEKECKLNSDCEQKECFTTTCKDNECVNRPIPNCCGNMMCEEGESWCSCKKDCVKENPCEGKIVLEELSSGKKIETEYLEYMCDKDDACTINFDRDKQRSVPLVFEKILSYFTLGVKVTVTKPFDIDNDKVLVEIEMKDDKSQLIPPVKITEIQILGGERLYGSKSFSGSLNGVGDTFKGDVPISFEPDEVETEERLKIKVFYEYTTLFDKNSGETKTTRNNFVKDFSEKLFLVNPGADNR